MRNIPVVEFRSARMSLKVSWCATHCLSYFKEQPTPRLSCFSRIFTCYKKQRNLSFSKMRTSLRPSSFAPIPLPNVQPIFSIIFTDFLFLSSDHFLPRGSSPQRDLLLRSASRPILFLIVKNKWQRKINKSWRTGIFLRQLNRTHDSGCFWAASFRSKNWKQNFRSVDFWIQMGVCFQPIIQIILLIASSVLKMFHF